MLVELLHPDTALIPGIGEVIFTTCIFAPAFWAGKAVHGKRRLDRVLYLTFLFSATSALVGFLQARYGLLMPAEFSSLLLQLNRHKVRDLTYIGTAGQAIIRPAGLSDVPGGAAPAAVYSVLLGIALALGLRRFGLKSLGYMGVTGIAAITLYLTQVRTMLIGVVLGLLGAVWAVSRHSKIYSMRMLLVALILLSAAFLYAVSVGGKSVSDRFATLTSSSPEQVYEENRGGFIQTTIYELLPAYPLGAGLGRWGMARTYTEHYVQDTDAEPIYVEIQITGWLLDGGVAMWVLYGAAILSSLSYSYRAATKHPDRDIRYFAGLVLTLAVIPVILIFDLPVFNTQLGAQFWLLSSALAGVCETYKRNRRAYDVDTEQNSSDRVLVLHSR